MEEFEQSVNSVELAEPQTEVTEPTQEPSASSEVADPKPVQDADTNAFYAEQRRKQELDQYRTQANEYQQQLDRTARLAGYQSHDELVKALDDIEKQQELVQYQEAGIDPDLLNKVIENHPAVKFANQLQEKQAEEQRFQSEVSELFSEFPNLKPDDIKPEVFQLQATKGLSLLDAYLRTNYKSLGQQAEQQAIQKLTQNQQTSTGALGIEGADHNKQSVKNMSKSEFESLIQRVKRGERVEL